MAIVKNKDVRSGAPVIEGTRIRVLDVGIEFEFLGMSPDEIVDAHPHLTLSQVHEALAYFYSDIEEMKSKIKQEKDQTRKVRESYSSRTAMTV